MDTKHVIYIVFWLKISSLLEHHSYLLFVLSLKLATMSNPIVRLATLSLRAEYINIIASDIFLLIRVPDSIVALVTKENFITITVLLPPLSSRKIYQPLVKS